MKQNEPRSKARASDQVPANSKFVAWCDRAGQYLDAFSALLGKATRTVRRLGALVLAIAALACVSIGLAGGVLIDDRPAEATDRVMAGHWEGDLITGSYNATAIATLVERTSGYVQLVHLPTDHSARAVCPAVAVAMMALPHVMRRSLTWDQGAEMAEHAIITGVLRDGVFFAHAGSPWQRGSNENTNGLLRQYFPKSTDLSQHTTLDLSAIIITRQAIRRGTFHSVKDLETAIGTYIDGWNERAHPFTWTKGADEIIAHAKPSPHPKKTYDPRH